MIRRKLSNGLLRATAQSQAVTHGTSASASSAAVAASPIQQQTANLASAVLLGSQRNWKTETVQVLKTELKRRGLSQQGNKATLIARISSAETSALLPPTPTIPKSLSSATAATSRTLSTSKSQSRPAAAAKSTEAPLEQTGSSPITSAGGAPVSSKRVEAAEPEPVPKENITVAPGLPESKADATDLTGFSVNMPRAHEDAEPDQIIPVEPDNFRAQQQTSKAEPTESTTPKVMTVASASTHLSGGPIHAIHQSTDSHSQDQKDASKSSNEGDAAPVDFAGAGAALASAVNSVVGAGKTVGEFGRTFVPAIGLPKSSGGGGKNNGGGEFKPIERGLDAEEKRGAWVLAGIVGLGLLLGGSKSDKKSLKAKASEAADKVKGVAGGVHGDAQWAKASGAEVVGHGTRKA